MTQNEIDLAVADATGESLETVTDRGFGMLTTIPLEYEREPLTVDWDLIELSRRVSIF
jgi:hypothetical protein